MDGGLAAVRHQTADDGGRGGDRPSTNGRRPGRHGDAEPYHHRDQRGGRSSADITSSPPLTVIVGQLYSNNTIATSPDGEPIKWNLLTAPADTSISSTRGTIH
jgi:hypothetical protein